MFEKPTRKGDSFLLGDTGFVGTSPHSVTVDHSAVAHDAPWAGPQRHGAARQPHALRVAPGQDHGVGKHEDCPAVETRGGADWKIPLKSCWYFLGGKVSS